MNPILVDDVLPDPRAYRAAVLEQPRRSHTISPEVVFHNIGYVPDRTLPDWIERHFAGLQATLSFYRLSPEGQIEPNFVHTDLDMGQWTGILYLNPDPPVEDGTVFWRSRDTGAIESVACSDEDKFAEWLAWRNPACWERWYHAAAAFNRLVLFPAGYFHSRAMPENWGAGDDARLVQIVFGTGVLRCQ